MECGALPLGVSAVYESIEIWEFSNPLPSPRTFVPSVTGRYFVHFVGSLMSFFFSMGGLQEVVPQVQLLGTALSSHCGTRQAEEPAWVAVGPFRDSGVGPGSLQLHGEISCRPEVTEKRRRRRKTGKRE